MKILELNKGPGKYFLYRVDELINELATSRQSYEKSEQARAREAAEKHQVLLENERKARRKAETDRDQASTSPPASVRIVAGRASGIPVRRSTSCLTAATSSGGSPTSSS